jgi:hypothetical protein
LDPLLETVGGNWNFVQEIAAPVFDTMIRQAGWHFMWMQGSCCRRGFGLTQEEATHRALSRALKGIVRRFNGAELNAVEVRKYPGFQGARVTLQPRQIQQQTSLEIPAEIPQRAFSAR